LRRPREKVPRAFLIEETKWNCLGGSFSAGGFRLNSSGTDNYFNLFIQDIELDRFINVISTQETTAKGRLTGVVPVRFSSTDTKKIQLGRGFLYATTGQGNWEFQESSLNSPIGQVLASQLERIPKASTGSDTQQLLKGLLDFNYDKLRIDLVEENTGLTAWITTQGKSRNPCIPVEFEEIKLAIPRVNEIINEIIKVKTAVEPYLDKESQRP